MKPTTAPSQAVRGEILSWAAVVIALLAAVVGFAGVRLAMRIPIDPGGCRSPDTYPMGIMLLLASAFIVGPSAALIGLITIVRGPRWARLRGVLALAIAVVTIWSVFAVTSNPTSFCLD